MKISTIGFALLYLAGLGCAAPYSSDLVTRDANLTCVDGESVYIRFLAVGTGPDDPTPPEFDQEFPTDGSSVAITNPLLVDTMYLVCRGDCTVTALDGSTTAFGGREPGFFRPNQQVVSAACTNE